MRPIEWIQRAVEPATDRDGSSPPDPPSGRGDGRPAEAVHGGTGGPHRSRHEDDHRQVGHPRSGRHPDLRRGGSTARWRCSRGVRADGFGARDGRDRGRIGNVANGGKAPFLASLVKQGAVAADYDALAEGSLPNCIGLFSGSTHHVADDGVHYLDSPSLFDQLDSHGKTWAVHAQNVPGSCFLGLSAEEGRDGPGTYVRRHEPAVSFTSIVADPVRCARIGDLSSFAPGRTDFTLIIPNMCADMHDCPVSVGDALLKKVVTKIRGSKSWSTDDLIVITFDEAGEGPQPPSRRPGLLALSGLARPGFVSHEDRNHYSLLRAIEDSWRLGCLANSCAAPALGELFGGP